MIKTSAIFSAHAIHVLIRNTLIFFVTLIFGLLIWLYIGIHVDTLQISNYQVSGLYIKLDKKLTLKADKVVIPRRKENPSADRIDETLERIKYLLTFFDAIDLKKIYFNNNVLNIYYLDNILQLSSKDYLLRGNIYRKGKMLNGHIYALQLKKYDIVVWGNLSYDLEEDILKTEGKFLFKELNGNFYINKLQNKVKFSLNSDTFSNLRSVIDQFNLPAGVKSWVVDKVQAKTYKLLSLSGEGDIKNKAFQMNMGTLQGDVLFSDVTVRFKNGVAPVVAPALLLSYTDSKGLFLDLKHPSYLGKNLKGSSVSIVNLRDDNTTLNLNLKFDTSFDEKVQKILHAYNIHIPVIQKTGTVKASLDIHIGLKEKYTKVAADIHFKKGEVLIQKISLPIVSGNVTYANGFVHLNHLMLKNDYYAGELNGKLDLKNQKLKSVFNAKYVRVGEKNNSFIDLKNQKLPFLLNYQKEIDVQIPKLTMEFIQKNKSYILKISDLNKVKPFISKDLPIENGGEVAVYTTDFKTYSYKGILKRDSCFLYKENNLCATKVPFEGTATTKDVDFYAFDKRLHFNKVKSRVQLNHLNIDLKKFLDLEKKKDVDASKKKKRKKIIILGTKSHLRYGAYSLITDSYDVEIQPNGDIKAIGSADGDIVKFSKIQDVLKLQALRVKDKVLHPLINFNGLQNGRYSLTKTGNPQTVMKGEIIVEGGMMKNFKAYNNTLAFINTLPALVTLHKPGYSSEGFKIISGVVTYRMIEGKKIIFDSIYIKGEVATIVGKGELDLVKKTMNINLGIQVAKDFGKMVGSIPLVGHILVGKDKSLTVGLKITGNIDKPQVNVSAMKDILSYPLELIKRTMEAPQELLSPKN